jgi:hypothetical protein
LPRPLRYALVALGALVFLVVSAGLARVLGAANAERDAAIEIVKAQSHGDGAQVIRSIRGCRSDAACRGRVSADVARLHSPGKVRILRLDGPSALAVRARTGTARIAWHAGDALPVVQCVRLRRGGDLLHGFRVRVLALSRPIRRDAGCPAAA